MMYLRGKKIPFPAITQVSFFKLYESLQLQTEDKDPHVAAYASKLVNDIKANPELIEGVDSTAFDPENETVQRLCRVLFPDVLLSNEIKSVMPPFEFRPFYMSTRFKNIIQAAEDDFSFELNDFTEDQLYIFGCIAILGNYYKYAVPMGTPTMVDIPNKKMNSVRTYRMAMNGDLLEVVPTKKALSISLEDFHELLDNFDNITLWKRKFPPDSWIMKGIAITNLMDVTVDHSLSTITSNLLIKTDDSLQKIQRGMANLFAVNDLRMGFVMYENDNFYCNYKSGLDNLILDGKERVPSRDNLCSFGYDQLINQGKPLVVSDFDRFDDMSKSEMSAAIRRQSIKSYIIAPIQANGEFLGFLELASTQKYNLNTGSLQMLNTIMPIISMAISRFKREDQNRREAIIQQECTTIHPSVKWRFEEEADRFMARQVNNERPVFSDIVFKNVYPLYGQLDIKGSSEKRNKAVRADLTKQLTEVGRVLEAAWKETKMPIYDELTYRVKRYRLELSTELLSGSEPRIISFLENEIHPVLDQIKNVNSALESIINAYRELLHPELNSIYDLRKKYDNSVNVINQSLASFLDKNQEDAQKMFPHYFERYKTDGVEYNIYIGQSISRSAEFSPVYLKNLQLWQLMATCELEQKFLEVKKELDSDIEIASLILAYNTPLSVHFRMDEKRFDVEGAYNARYEIVKKRIDKAHIKGTNERVTMPGKIAIIYANDQDALTYGKYISFLEDKDYLVHNSKEVLEIEDLQGITGLKALRVAVNYGKKLDNDAAFDMSEILEELQNN